MRRSAKTGKPPAHRTIQCIGTPASSDLVRALRELPRARMLPLEPRELVREQGLDGSRHGYRGMLPCLRRGRGSAFVSAVSSASISTGRVRRGSITSST